MPSKLYERALAEARAHHADNKTYSGALLRPHKVFLTELIRENGIASAIDYGCGKGEQYRWVDPADGLTLEQAWGFEVFKFDPAWPPYEVAPIAQADLVICTHTLGSIPLIDQTWVLDLILNLATKVVFVAEKIGPIKKGVHDRQLGFANEWTRPQWEWLLGDALIRRRHVPLAPPAPIVVLSSTERTPEGKITERSVI